MAINRIKKARRGGTTIEYGLMLSLVTAAVLLIAMTLGEQAREVFGKLGGPLGSEVAAGASGSAGTGKNASSPAKTVEASGQSAAFKLASLIIVAAVLASSALALTLARKRAERKEEEPQPRRAPAKPQPGYVGKRQEILKSLASAGRRVLHNQLAAEQIMSRRLTKVLPDAALDDVRELMARQHLRHVLVCDPKDKLLGVISDRDTLGDKQGSAQEIMTPNPITIEPETRASVLVSILLDRHISCLPVLQDGKLVGIVTTSDIAMTLQCTLQLIEQLVNDLEGLAEGSSFVVPDSEAAGENAECSLSA